MREGLGETEKEKWERDRYGQKDSFGDISLSSI